MDFLWTCGLLVPTSGAAAATPFVGPFDDVSDIVLVYSVRRLLAAYEDDGLRLRRDSDSLESDFGFDANGDLDVAAIATWLAGSSGYVTAWYDQSGNENDASQSVALSQPLYIASGQNGKPVVDFDGTDDYLNITTPITNSEGAAFIGMSFDSELTAAQAIYCADDDDTIYRWLNLAVNDYLGSDVINFYYRGAGGKLGSTDMVNGGTYYLLEYMSDVHLFVNGGAETLYNHGAGWSGEWFDDVTTPRSDYIGARFEAGSRSNEFNGKISELVMLSAVPNVTIRQAIETAVNNYWSLWQNI